MAKLHHEEGFLLSAASSIEADMIEAILKSNDIPVLKKYKESGGYLKIYMGDTIYGVDLYVPQPLLDKAREIIEFSREAPMDETFPDNIVAETEQDNADLSAQADKFNHKRRLSSWLILLLFIPGIIWVIITLIRYLFEQF